MSEEESFDDDDQFIDEEEEYIDEDNDPCGVIAITEKNSISIEDEEKTIEFDEVFETVRTKITNLTNYDKMMNEKVLDALRRGKLK